MGVEGRYRTVLICTIAGAICSRDGILQAQLDGIVTVPKPTVAATIWPIKYDELNREVRIGLSFGYPSSPIRADPATMQNGMPNPRRIRATTYIAAAKS